MNELKFNGENLADIIVQNPFFDTYGSLEVLEKGITDGGAFAKGCLTVNVDPEIVEKQAVEIVKLQSTLDIALNEQFKLNAPSFVEYTELLKRYKKCVDKLKKIKADIDTDETDTNLWEEYSND